MRSQGDILTRFGSRVRALRKAAGLSQEAFGEGNGDFDIDCDVDLSDAARMQRCIGQPAAGACAAGDCAGGGSVNLADWSAFAGLLGGPL